MKKIFNVIHFLLAVYCAIYFILVASNILSASKINKILIFIWFIFFSLMSFLKAINQFVEMRLINWYDKKFDLLVVSYQPNTNLDNEIYEFINDINNTIYSQNLKKYNKEHLLEMVEYLNNLLSTTVSS